MLVEITMVVGIIVFLILNRDKNKKKQREINEKYQTYIQGR